MVAWQCRCAPLPGPAVLDRLPVRVVVSAAVVLVLILIGIALDADSSTQRLDYAVALTFPASLLFQRFISRRPIRALWVRAAPPFRLDRLGVLLALLLAITPAVVLVRDVRHEEWAAIPFGAVVIVGAVAAAYAIRAMTRTTLRQLVLCLATAGVIGLISDLGLEGGGVFDVHFAAPVTRHALEYTGLPYFLLYIPGFLVVEEVLFRGAIDSYIHRPGEGTLWTGLLSALFVSLLWALWHVQFVYPEDSLPEAVLYVLPTQLAMGVPLSLWWRRSGNLMVTGTTHAFVDAVRNATTGFPSA